MKISEVLLRARDEHLWSGIKKKSYRLEHCTCYAIAAVNPSDCSAINFVESLGVDTGSFVEFLEFVAGPERQGARFLFLTFAAMVAESEGI